jgi:Tetratricopeptide repeat
MSDDRRARAQRLYVEGVELQQRGNLDRAIGAWRQALALDALHADARYNLAVGLGTAGDAPGAEASYVDLLAHCPDHCKALFNLANLKMREGAIAAAEPLYRRLLSADPRFVGGWINLAMARSAQGDADAAETCLRTALRVDPDNVGAHWSLANLLLTGRRWAEGWREYEWRLRRAESPRPPVPARDWTADETQARRVLLWNDQGLGDTLQFLRYAPALAARGHEVWLFVQDALKGLARSVARVAGVVDASDTIPHVDAQAPLSSLPHRLGLPDPAAFPPDPYVRAGRPMALPRRHGHRAIGLVWRSNPAHPHARLRDVPLAELGPLLETPGIDWFSLQVGEATREIAASGFAGRLHDLSPRIRDFGDTAAAVAALDLVITVDTSMPHLVGAMARPGWVMVSTAREWRWAGRESTSLWYPSLRLFRQHTGGDWPAVVAAIAVELRS